MIATITEPRRAGATLVLATLVTLLAVVPLGVLAWRAQSDDVPADGIAITVNGGSQQLGASTLPTGGPIEVSLEIENLAGAAWAIYEVDGNERAAGATSGPSPLSLDHASKAIDQLDTGQYDFLVTATLADGTTTERAARFEIGDAP